MNNPSLFNTWIGILTIILSLVAALGLAAALLSRRDTLERAASRCILATALAVTITTIVALARHVLSWTSTAVYTQLFLAASLFTLALTLLGWRERNENVLWKPETRILYMAGHLGCLGLAIALVRMG
jgi:hypothetical protein